MKEWEGLYTEITELQNKIKARDKKSINDYTEELSLLINTIKDHKTNLIQQLKDQGVDATDGNTLTELIEMIEEIEGGGGVPDYDFLANIEEISNYEVKVGDYIFKTRNGEGMGGEFPIFRGLKAIRSFSFSKSKFTGEFPSLPNIESIDMSAFENSNFTGEFPLLPNLKLIRSSSIYSPFKNSKFTGGFPLLPNIEIIEEYAFRRSNFMREFPPLPNIKEIERYTFENSKFTGEFPLLQNIKEIGARAFYRSEFTKELPYMETLEEIGSDAFYTSNFDKDEDGFVKNYPGWDGRSSWSKPAAYRAIMADKIPPKVMSIIAPGAGEIEILDDIQGERAKQYLKDNEPSDINYYLEYTEKLRSIGFERDQFGNYVDVVNDKSVIIIPEDIKFLV